MYGAGRWNEKDEKVSKTYVHTPYPNLGDQKFQAIFYSKPGNWLYDVPHGLVMSKCSLCIFSPILYHILIKTITLVSVKPFLVIPRYFTDLWQALLKSRHLIKFPGLRQDSLKTTTTPSLTTRIQQVWYRGRLLRSNSMPTWQWKLTWIDHRRKAAHRLKAAKLLMVDFKVVSKVYQILGITISVEIVF